MTIPELPLSFFIDHVEQHEPVTFSRWGDGEWKSLWGRKMGHNCDRHQFFPQMGMELQGLLKRRPNYILGLQNLARRIFHGRIEEWIEANGLGDLHWVDADVFHHASGDGSFQQLVLAMMVAGPITFVGPPHLERLRTWFPDMMHVQIPLLNVYSHRRDVWERTENAIVNRSRGHIVGVSASMPAKLLIDYLHEKFPGKYILLDFGSVWDPYCGVKSRKYHAQIQELAH